MVAAQAVALQALADKVFGLFKHLRFGTPKTVNALLGIAHDKHAGRTAGPGVARNPGLQSFPLQRVGVLKFINQQMAHLRVQPLLYPGAHLRVVQEAVGAELQVVHVEPAALAFQGGVILKEHTRQTQHALLVGPGQLLCVGLAYAQHQGSGGYHRGIGVQGFAKAASAACLGQQGIEDARRLALGEGAFQLTAFGDIGSLAGGTQNARRLAQHRHGPFSP